MQADRPPTGTVRKGTVPRGDNEEARLTARSRATGRAWGESYLWLMSCDVDEPAIGRWQADQRTFTSAPLIMIAMPLTGAGRPSRRHAEATACGSRTSVVIETMCDKSELLGRYGDGSEVIEYPITLY